MAYPPWSAMTSLVVSSITIVSFFHVLRAAKPDIAIFVSNNSLVSFQQIASYQQFIYVAGRNVLLQLDTNLKLKRLYKTGRVREGCKVSVRNCKDNFTDNAPSILEINFNDRYLIRCGTGNLGVCYEHSLENIQKVRNFSRDVTNYAGSESSSVAFFGEMPSNLVQLWKTTTAFYVGMAYDHRDVHFMPKTISTRKIDRKSTKFTKMDYVFSYADSQFSALDVKKDIYKNYRIKYIYAFQYDGYGYFLKIQPSHPKRTSYETRLGRVCLNDTKYANYIETQLMCVMDVDYLLATAAWLHRSSGAASLVVAFGRHMDSGMDVDPKLGSAICEFSLANLHSAYINGVRDCYLNAMGSSLDWVYDIRNCKKSREVTISDRFCFDSTTTNRALKITKVSLKAIYINRGTVVTSVCAITQARSTVIIAGHHDGSIVKMLSSHPRKSVYRRYALDQAYHHPQSLVGQSPIYRAPRQTLKKSNSEVFASYQLTDGVPIERDVTLNGNSTIAFFIAANRIFRFPLDSCRLHSTCSQCVLSKGHDPLNCGWCVDRCTTQGRCKGRSWYTSQCQPVIHKISPDAGPTSGGTFLTITGENLGSARTSRSEVSVGGVICTIQSSNLTLITCITGASRYVQNAAVDVTVDDSSQSLGYSIKGRASSQQNFYYKVPLMSSFDPQKGPNSGGTKITIVGENLDIGIKLEVSVAGRDCPILSKTSRLVVCLTTKMVSTQVTTTGLLELFIDGNARVNSSTSDEFTYMPDPRITKIWPKRSFVSGGVPIHIAGSHLNSVAYPKMKVHERIATRTRRVPSRSYVINCKMESDKEVVCPSANISENHPAVDPNQPIRMEIELIMDGVPDSELYASELLRRSQISYYPDPVFHRFDEDGNLKLFDLQDELLILKGQHLSIQYAQDSTAILIGHSLCNITAMSDDRVSCAPQKPSSISENEPKRLVIVTLGLNKNLVYDVGYLRYVSQQYDSLSVGIIVLITLLCIIVITIGFLLCVMKRYQIGPFKRRADVRVVYQPGRELEPPQGSQRTYNLPEGYHDKTPTIEGAEGGATTLIDDEMMELLKDHDLLIDREYLSLGDILGQGHFGCVYHGDLTVEGHKEAVEVAVKTLHKNSPREIDVMDFLNEAITMKNFQHPNILTLIGICLGKDEMPLVVLPFMKHGDLLKYIRDVNNSPTVKNLIMFGMDIASGMEYLSELRFVHRDLAARNCMLNDEMRVTVADFGLSRDIYERDYYSSDNKRTKLPVKWMALESLERGTYNAKTDVWAYGIVLWELMTRGVTPYPEVNNWDMTRYLKAGRRLPQPQPSYCPKAFYNIMLSCWAKDPDARPTFKELRQQITDMIAMFEQNSQQDKSSVNISETYVDLKDSSDCHYTDQLKSETETIV